MRRHIPESGNNTLEHLTALEPPTFLFKFYRGLFLPGQSARIVKLSTHILLLPKLRMGAANMYAFSYAFMACIGTKILLCLSVGTSPWTSKCVEHILNTFD